MRNIENYTESYADYGFEKFQVKYRRKLVLEQIARYNPTHILEIGCGYEPLFQYVEGVEFTCIEPSEVFYKNAVNLSKQFSHAACIHGFFEEIADTLSHNYDMIICSGLLHEVEKPALLLECIKKVCNQNTVVHINVPNANSMHRLLALESGYIQNTHDMSMRNKELQQHNVFDMESLTALVEAKGMKVEGSGSYFVKPFTHAQMEKNLESGILSEEILDGLFRMEKYMPGLGSEIYVNCRLASLDSNKGNGCVI